MKRLGTVSQLWRYPVKSMAGETLDSVFVGFSGVYGDRLYAFKTPAGPTFFPYLTGRDYPGLLQYQPGFAEPASSLSPIAWAEAESTSIGITPVYRDAEALQLQITTPGGDTLPVDAPALLAELSAAAGPAHAPLQARRSERAQTDCRPLSLISEQTIAQLSEETGMTLDTRRFRANIYMDLSSDEGFAEHRLIGAQLQIGDKVKVSIVQHAGRCAMITLDPDTGAESPDVLKHVTLKHQRNAGIYAAILQEGLVHSGDPIHLLD